jgi:very-short-patch-repair endonuclease
LLSHCSAAALWGITKADRHVHVTSRMGRPGRRGIALHRARLHPEDRAVREGIPVTSVARTIFDLSELVDRDRFVRVAEEADRLRLLELAELRRLCDRNRGRRALQPIHEVLGVPVVVMPDARSELERRFVAFCRERELPQPAMNVVVEGFLVDAFWPRARVVVELDGFAFHRHRAAFERDRARDAALQVAGYKIMRLTHHRLSDEATAVASQLRRLLRSGDRGD